jgi:acetyl esterase
MPAPEDRQPHDLLTPGMAQLLARIERARRVPFHQMAPQAARAAYDAAAEVLDLARAPLPRVETFTVATLPGVRCRARLYAPRVGGDPLPALLYLHGGGFVIGGLETHDSLCRQLALRSGGAVLALDYRLAPEHRFPAAVDDAFGALQWLHGHAAALGLDATRLAIGGDSAGGTLAAVAALMARDIGLPLVLQLLITPGTASERDTDSYRRFGKRFLLDTETIAWFLNETIDPALRHDWRFAPLNAHSFDDVAPAFLLLAECDPVFDEGLAYADRLRFAGVPVEIDLHRGVTHDFIKMGRALPEALLAQQAAADALRKAWNLETQ